LGWAEALESVLGAAPALVLLDMRMPQVDGLTVLARLRLLDPAIPVVMVTANSDADVARETLASGAFDYITKPFDLSHVGDVVAAAFPLTDRFGPIT
jgi:CheY-like chemotaxis protein